MCWCLCMKTLQAVGDTSELRDEHRPYQGDSSVDKDDCDCEKNTK